MQRGVGDLKEYTESAASSLLQENDLEQFIRCPCCYGRRRKQGRVKPITWKQIVQKTIEDVVRDFYLLPHSGRTAAGILASIDRRWSLDEQRFIEENQMMQVKHKITHQLLKYLLMQQEASPLFLLEEMTIYVEELDTMLFMMFQVVEWTDSSYVIKKFVIDDEPHVIKAYLHMCLIFACRAFGKLPDRIEVYPLLKGTSYSIRPDAEDVMHSLDFLHLIQGVMHESTTGSSLLPGYVH